MTGDKRGWSVPPTWLYRHTTVAPLGAAVSNILGAWTMVRATTKNTTTRTDEERNTPPILETPVLEGDELARARAWFEDKVIREVRSAGHCSEALAVLKRVFGKPREGALVYDTHSIYSGYGSKEEGGKLFPAFVDSDGVDCWGNKWRDKDGFDAAGLDPDGRDKDGYDANGRDSAGFDRDGNDANGVHKDAPERYAYDRNGFNAEGFNAKGFDKEGYDKDGLHMDGVHRRDRGALFIFDAQGFNVRGYNAGGYNRDGRYSEEEYLLARGMDRQGRLLR